MQNVKLIIGANYGDEGKGLATDFFGAQAADSFGTINVLTNGGPQGKTTSLTIYTITQYTTYGNMGYGAALAVLTFIISMIIAVFISN